MVTQRKRLTSAQHKSVTLERATRLYRMLRLLSAGPQTRDFLKKRLRLDVRGFYRDLELLRGAGILVPLRKRLYTLAGDVEDAIARLPFPDPHLNLGEAVQLAKGRGHAHRRLRSQLARIRR